MKRTFLAAVSLAPLLTLAAGGAGAQVQITGSTSTPVATATANNGAPDDIDIVSGGSIGDKASGAAVTLNSNNTVTNAGQIGFTDVDNAVAIQVLGGFTGNVINTGTINVTESYAPTDTNQDGLIDGAFAMGSNRFGIQVTGASPFVGGITSSGSIIVHGNDSAGISIEVPITGDLLMQTITPSTTAGAAPTITPGSISLLGDDTVGLQITQTGSVGGRLLINSISASGLDARAVVIGGAVAGKINISGAVTSTGYRSTARGTVPALTLLYTPEELQQGGPAVTIGANVGGGLIVSAPPIIASTTSTTPTIAKGAGQIASFGAAPGLVVGAAGANVEVGEVGTGSEAFGIVNQGSIIGDGVFDQFTSPKLPAPVSGTAMQIGVVGGGAAVIDGGISNTGTNSRLAFQAGADGIRLLAGGGHPDHRQ